MYVIQRNDGKFVTPAGSVSSYTSKLQNARQFATYEQASQELCPENERVITVDQAMSGAAS